ncbi:MAG: T9SS type A sorting domain-containing protein [Bacteroidia bacterium]
MVRNLSFTAILSFILNLGFSQTTTYKDVAGIFYARCTNCHHANANHYSFMNFTEVNTNKFLIQNALTSNKMPPWQVDTTYTRFRYERLISDSEKSQILNWIASGATKGDTTMAPPQPIYPPVYKLKGNADLTVQIPTYTSSATTADHYICFSIPTNLPTDRIVRAYEIVPGNPQIVHHAVITVDTTNSYNSDLSGSCFNIPGDFELGTYAPGSSPLVLPSKAPLKAGIRLKANSRIILQMHYPKGSAGEVDSTKIRLYFYPQGEPNIRELYITTPLQNWNMIIPANTTQTFVAYYPNASSTTTAAVSLFGVFPHAHLLGKTMKLYAANPGIDTIPMIRINHWDFEWQDYYLYKNLVKIPAGYRFNAWHTYDNTTNNPNNPNNPPIPVFAGTGTNDEMLFDGIMFLPYQTGDELIDLDAIVKADTLLANQDVGLNELKELKLKTLAFPNPFNGKVEIKYSLNKSSDVKIRFSDILGRTLCQYNEGNKEADIHTFVWDESKHKNLPSGVYFYTIIAGDKQVTNKITKTN